MGIVFKEGTRKKTRPDLSSTVKHGEVVSKKQESPHHPGVSKALPMDLEAHRQNRGLV